MFAVSEEHRPRRARQKPRGRRNSGVVSALTFTFKLVNLVSDLVDSATSTAGNGLVRLTALCVSKVVRNRGPFGGPVSRA